VFQQKEWSMKTYGKIFKTQHIILCGLVALAGSNQVLAANYSICELGALPGCGGGATNISGVSYGHGINPNHNYMSVLKLATGSASGGSFCDPKAFYTLPRGTAACPPGLGEIATPGFNALCAYASQGSRVVGVRQLGACGVFHAFRYPHSSPGALDIGTTGGDNSVAYAVNDNGHIVGTSQINAGAGEKFHAFRQLASVSALVPGDDLGTLPGGENSVAYGINNSIIVGASETVLNPAPTYLHPEDTYFLRSFLPFQKAELGKFHAFYHVGGGTLAPGDDLGTLGGDNSVAYAINDYRNSNVVVGTSQVLGGVFHAFRHLTKNMPLQPADDIHTGLFESSVAYAVNDLMHPEVVGMGIIGGFKHAFLWLPFAHYNLAAGMHDLNDEYLASAGADPDWSELTQATGIRTTGGDGTVATIVGTGIYKGQYRAFILTVRP
jgi:probable HAF family extracellular repeat protein